MIRSFVVVACLLFGSNNAQRRPVGHMLGGADSDQGSFPKFISQFTAPIASNFGQGLGPNAPNPPPSNPVPNSQMPPSSIQNAIQNAIQQQPSSASSSNQPQPNVYGPVETNWTSCPSGFLCCSQSVYKDTYKLLACCDDDSYDTRFQKCQQGVILPLVAGMPTPTPADRLIRINCGGYLYITTDRHRCCNFAVYDPDVQMCISGQVQSRPKPSQAPLPLGSVYVVCASYRFLLSTQATLTWGCCGQQLYNYNRENCTAGNVDPPRSVSDAAQVPKGELMIFCTGKRHWIEPANLGSTRCCGTEICPLQSAPVVLNNNNNNGPNPSYEPSGPGYMGSKK